MKFLEYSCFKPPQSTFSLSKSQCSWCPLFGESPQPTQRSSHAICVFQNQIFMYGGRGDKGTLKEFWTYDCDTLQWKELPSNGSPPPRLEGHSMVVYDGNIYIFGGETSFASADESPLWQFDIDERKWTKLGSTGAVMAPCGRRQHSAILYMDAMCIYGGYQDLIGPTKEIWLFDFASKSWHFDVAASCDTAPDARYGHCAAVNNQSMWVCGGLTGLKPNSEVLAWNFELLIWISLKAKGGPSELSGHAMCSVNNALYVFGGCNSSGESSNDMWRLSLSESTWKRCHHNSIAKPPAISGHCLIMYRAPLLKKSDLRTRSFPDIKKKRSYSKSPPTNQRSASCGKLTNDSKYSLPLRSDEVAKPSDKAALITKQDTKVLYAYENPLTEMVDNDIEILPKFDPISTVVAKPTASPSSRRIKPFSVSTVSKSKREIRTGYISSRQKYGSLASGGNSLTTFSYNLLEDSFSRHENDDVEETSFISLPSEDTMLVHQQVNVPKATSCGSNPDYCQDQPFPVITNVKPLFQGSPDLTHEKHLDMELESLDRNLEREDCSPVASYDIDEAESHSHGETASLGNRDIAQCFQVAPTRNDDYMLMVFGGKVSTMHPSSNKPFSLWQCNISPATC